MDDKEKNAEVAKAIKLPDLASYMQVVIKQIKIHKKWSAVHTYTYTLKSVTEFYGGKGTPVPIDEAFTSGRLKEYEEWMRLEGTRNKKTDKKRSDRKHGVPKGLSLNTISTYMRTLKAVYNRLADKKILPYNPKLFDNVYTKVESQTKRALDTKQMNTLLHTDIEKLPKEMQCALAYFLLMFLFRGMPFIDLAHLRKQDVKGKYIVYSRHKTGRQITVRIPKEAMKLIEKFKNMNYDSIYLFPILDKKNAAKEQSQKNGKIKKDKELYMNYLRVLRNFNLKLEKIATLLLPDVKLSSYTPRHTWATLAFHAGVNIGIICKALGHSYIKVTETYLKPFENEKVDIANDELIISVVAHNGEKEVA